MWYNPLRMTNQYYKGWPRLARWPTGTPKSLAAERRHDLSVFKENLLRVLKVVSYVVTAAISFLGGLQF